MTVQHVIVPLNALRGHEAGVSEEPITKLLTHTSTRRTMTVRVSNERTAASFCQNSAQDKGTNAHPVDRPWGQKMRKHAQTLDVTHSEDK